MRVFEARTGQATILETVMVVCENLWFANRDEQ